MSTEEQTQGRSRRRTTLAVASVAAAVLLAGGGGAYLATSASGDKDGAGSPAGPAGDGTPPPLALDGYAAGGDPGTSNGIAPGEPDPNGTTYRATVPLPKGPGDAPVYRAEGEVSAAEVSALGKALDIDGTPKLTDGAWRLGPAKDGSGPSLQVNRAAPGTWTYALHAPSAGDKCAGVAKCPDPVGSGSEKDAVSEAAAKKAAAPVLKALGQDDAKLDAAQLMGATRVVNADPVVGGLPTYGWSTGIQVGADGQVVGGSGQLKAPVKGDTYPTASAEQTLKRMNGSASGDRVAVGGCASAVPLERGGADQQGTGCTPSSPRPPASSTTEVTKATFGLAAQHSGGRQILVPSWLFQVKPAGATEPTTVTHPAVAPEFLVAPSSAAATPPEGAPSPRPSASPGESGTDTRDVRVSGYEEDGKKLTLHFTGGVCATYRATVDESKDRVSVKVTATQKKGTVCIMMAKFYTLDVTLDGPLDGRKVVGSDGHEVRVAQQNGPGGVKPAPRG
ncbi:MULTISPECIES: hypothetical protein [Streptomyces]|uniref:Large membrane protein n=1 Tax=Streptomyces xanthii TaxID=2768069 RepID=A0A7H1BD62_9ACTN|nr:hypothetical protein [Streptomyces xanthii]QNS06667.1 hypothetical protein IAG42_25840 [Streptomyces xanthii]